MTLAVSYISLAEKRRLASYWGYLAQFARGAWHW